MSLKPLFESNLKSLKLLSRGKVRDMYEINSDTLLMVQTDRLSAFDVVLPTAIPSKGSILTEISQFWFSRLSQIIPNHLLNIAPSTVVEEAERAQIIGRSMVVRKLKPLPIEAIVRGYLFGSGWREYTQSGQVCGIPLAPGMLQSEKLPQPIFTPSTKAVLGQHDENIEFSEAVRLLGSEQANKVRNVSEKLYLVAAKFLLERGIIMADTKFEFGTDPSGKLYLIDEVITPDSSRFWPKDNYRADAVPVSFDKQYVRNWLEETGWNKMPPAPSMPDEVVRQTQTRYEEVKRRLIA